MKIIVVSNFCDLPHEHDVLNLLFCEGLQHYHLRKVNYTENQMRNYLDRIPHYFHPRIVLHSHYSLVDEYGLKGAHFTKMFTYQDYLQTLSVPHGPPTQFEHLSFSAHSIPEIKEMNSLFHYIFLSPVFDSISNQGYHSKFKVSDLRAFLHQEAQRTEIIALGGITDRNIPKIAELGFEGFALLGHIWTIFESDQDIAAAVRRFRTIQRVAQVEVDVPQ